jgi:hypothetical protein
MVRCDDINITNTGELSVQCEYSDILSSPYSRKAGCVELNKTENTKIINNDVGINSSSKIMMTAVNHMKCETSVKPQKHDSYARRLLKLKGKVLC